MRLLTYACATDTVILLLRHEIRFTVTEIMSRRITLREACSLLGVQKDDLNLDNDKDAEEFFPGDSIEEKDEERVATVDDEGDIEVLEERHDDGTELLMMKKPPLMKPHTLFKVMKKSILLIIFKVEAVLLINLSRYQIEEDAEIFSSNNQEL